MGAFNRLFLVLFLLFGAELVTADLTELENRIIAIAERDKESAIALLARTVNINSGTMNHLGVKAVGDIFAEEFQDLGLTTTWHDMSEVNRAGHLFAETEGESGSRCLLLIGHLDTVFEPDSPFQTFDRQGDHATGPGVNDMKGGDVVILYALKALKEVSVLDDLNLIVALIGDEEKSGSPKSISRYHLIEASKRCDIALGFEIATSLNAATVARRGSSGWRLDVTGKRAHSAGIFNDEVGSGAIFEAARILNQFHEQLTGEEYLTFNPGVILGGTDVDYDPSRNKGGTFGKTNVVAQSVVVHGGLRTISPAQEASARARMKAIAENNHLPKTSAQITFQDGYPSMPPTEGNMAVLANLSGVSVDLDQGEVVAFDPGKRGAADVSFVAGYVDVIDGVGAEGNGAHTLDESIDLATLPLLIQRAAILIHRLSTVEHY
ncbi:M20/M25/M40 family metallo-hydrolase [Pseudomonadales bacterium]|nr:M20/M25/M40 family metallo-hydrolase [Pseudomonadales bacterium]